MPKRRPDALLVLYDEAKGLKQPQVKLFNPSPRVEAEVNDWVRAEEDVTVHRIDWMPSQGLLGASVLYSRNDPTQSLRIVVPGLETEQKRARRRGPIERMAAGFLAVGLVLLVGGLALFTIFYPETWYGGPDALLDNLIAVKSTVLVLGLGLLLVIASIASIARTRVR